eukprot:CAMPEP_0181313198 /NCGR_PEP_ID=MMETSP1101-20121128/14119_1 /TAXON_ID=46948 /ORGANISM="Rhodomonas abbreviata, Strain Caron Lab Isolate" /LENGTH=104 /DNA_ID=CAMNT_0023420133 /DNA_START=10 /DNA_END=324 /DNA_ORIENTATION=-
MVLFHNMLPGAMMLADTTTNSFPNAHVARWTHPPPEGHTGDVGDGTWGGTNPPMPWGWKGGKTNSGIYDNVLDDATTHVWQPLSAKLDPTEYQNEFVGQVIGIY